MSVELRLLSRVAYRGRDIVGPRQCGLLALLAGEPRTGCGTARLVDGLWPDEQPEHPAKALQVVVSRVRAQAGADIVARTAGGYRLAVPAPLLDTEAVLLHAAAAADLARGGDHAGALARAEEGLALWDGAEPADPGLADPLSVLRAERDRTRRALLAARAVALSRLGRHAEAVGPLTEAAALRPKDEAVLLELLRAEAATAGTAAALERYETYRATLRDELGADPGPALQDVHRRLLRDEAPAVRRGVPHDPNPLLGRDDDIAAVTELLATSRVASVVGTGGLGKTRLAYAVSRQARQPVVQLVALAGVAADADVAPAVASALGVAAPADGPGAAAAIAAALGTGPALLVLDNCEHVVRGAADLVRDLVAATGDLRVLTTSRAPLGLSSEVVYPLPELDLATTVELFRQRARAARPGADVPGDVVRQLCARLDGLPLAVELAAARVRVMSVTEMARRLDDRLALLRGGARDAPPRHHTLHAVIDWSWNLLTEPDRAAMRALSVFPGGFTAGAARHVLAEAEAEAEGESEGGDDVLLALTQLADQSLLKVTDTPFGTRFRMLETVREFSTAHRERAGGTGRAVDGLLAWAGEFGVAHAGAVFGTDLVREVERVRAEQDNLVLALRHAVDRADGPAVAAAAGVLAALWTVEGSFVRMTALARDVEWVMSHVRPAPALVEVARTAALLCAMNDFLMRGPMPGRFLVALRRLPPTTPDTLIGAADAVRRAMTRDEAALWALCDSDEPLLAGIAYGAASYLCEQRQDTDGALRAARRMLAVLGTRTTPLMRAVAHSRIGELLVEVGRGEEAAAHLAETLAVLDQLRRPGVPSSASRVRGAMALASLQRGALDEAEDLLEQAVQSAHDPGDDPMMFGSGVRAEILIARGDVDAGLALWREVVARLDAAEGQELPGSAGWAMEVRATTVIAHAQHGRLDLVPAIVDGLPDLLARLLASSGTVNAVGGPVYGALLLALAVADLDRGRRTGDTRVAACAARMIALAEAFRFTMGFQPTMHAGYARDLAEQADAAEYVSAASDYAALERDALREAASAVLLARRALIGAERG
ncbi:BTAD domain-containing putative transcriptional regulator [Dactylosporangium sp. NPDC006015]|uniref:ATP-binding protein n=1 Tax=Dactylosporangium sp. NPDC006015 TaxID=3154576 RepID=UPI0033A33128